jgi:outer membrane receptor protein involved in Fe transport
VTGESPIVDTSTTAVGTNFTKELLTEIPNARDVWAAMSQAPGFQMTGYDVGGSHAGTQTGFVTYGVSQQRTTRIEGINTTEGTDANAGYFDFGSFEEFQLGAAGSGADQDTPGASMNITVKSGADRFTGQWYSDWEGDATISNNVPDEWTTTGGTKDGFVAPAGGVRRGNQIDKQYDLNGNVGGPVYRGKAWFFTSWRYNDQVKYITGLPQLATSTLKNFTLKGTYQLNRSNQLIGYWNRREKLQAPRDVSVVVPVSAAYYQSSQNYPFKGEWTSVLSDRLFLDVIFGDWRNYFPLRPTDEGGIYPNALVPGRIELNSGQYLDGGASDFYQKQRRFKPQYMASLAYFKDNWKGTHDFKFGLEGRWEKRLFFRDEPFNIFYRDRGTSVSELDIYNTPNDGDNRTNAHSFYVQDTWKLSDNFTLNLGLRMDYYKDWYPDQTITPEGIPALANATDPRIVSFLSTQSFEGTTVAETFTVGPRAGFAWDFRGDGKTVVKGYFGRFYFNSAPDTLAALENPVGTAQLRYRFNDLNGNRVLDGQQELGAFLSTQGGAGFVRIDRDINRPYSDEMSAHFEQELVEGLSGRVSYVYKNIRNDWAEVDLARVNGYTTPVTVTDPGPDNTPNTGDEQTLQLYDRQPGLPQNRTFTNPDGPEYTSDYQTIEVALNRRFRGRWMALTAFGYTRMDQFWGVTSTTSALDSIGLSKAYNWIPNQRNQGDEGKDVGSLWSYKLIGRYVFNWDIGVSGSYKLQSGRNFGRTINAALPVSGSQTVLVESPTAQRAPNVGILDVRVDKTFKLGRYGRLTGMFDVFNLTNSSAVTNFRITTAGYKGIIALLDPRIIRLGVRWDF